MSHDPSGDDNAVVRRPAGHAILGIAVDDLHLPVSGLVEARAGAVGHLGVDVDRAHLAVRPGELGDQRCVVAA